MGLIPPYESDIVNPSTPSKPMLCARFGSTIMKYTFMLPPPKVGMKGNVIHRQKTGKISIQTQ